MACWRWMPSSSAALEGGLMRDDLLIQRPAAAPASRLVLLFHGVGSSAEDLRPIGQALAARLPQAFVVSVRAPDRCDCGRGWQWFPVQGVTEVNRPARVAAAMPRFVQTVSEWQGASGLGADATALIGFSQGAIMTLESTQHGEPLARQVIAIAGRFAQPPRIAPHRVALHLLHGEQDPVMPVALAAQAASQWQSLGGRVTLDRFPGLGHGIDERVLRRLLESLEA